MRTEIFVAWTIWVLGAGAAVASSERPNFLWLSSEDNGPELGCYGDPDAITPNLDALAARGVRYLRASSNAPVCAPARTVIITGMDPTSFGGQHMRSQVRLPEGMKLFPQFLREAGYYCTNNRKEDYNVVKPGKVWDESSGKAHYRNRKEGQPFFAVFNFTTTHESQIRNGIAEEHRIHDPAKIRVPGYHPDTPEVRQGWAQYHDRITMMDRQIGQALEELEEAGLAEDTIIFYWGDHGSGMPRSKRWPYNSGLHVPLIVHFPEKWKSLAPEGYTTGGTSERMVSFMDLGPTMLSLAGIEPPQWMQGRAFAGEHEVPGSRYSFGFRGRMDERYDLVRTVMGSRYVYLRHYQPHRIYGQFVNYMFQTPATRSWKEQFEAGDLYAAQARFWKEKPAEELYDLEADPDETVNLAGSSEHEEVLEAMRAAHRAHVLRIRDLGFLHEAEIHQRAREAGVTPYEMARDPEKYDFASIFAAAQQATSRDPGDLPKIVDMMASSDDGVRYWGAMGLLIHGRDGVETGGDALRKAMEDPSGPVRVTAAEALGRFGGESDLEAALEVLKREIQPEADVFVAISAWNALDYLDERAAGLVEAIKATDPKPKNAPNGRVTGYGQRLKEKTLSDLEG